MRTSPGIPQEHDLWQSVACQVGEQLRYKYTESYGRCIDKPLAYVGPHLQKVVSVFQLNAPDSISYLQTALSTETKSQNSWRD